MTLSPLMDWLIFLILFLSYTLAYYQNGVEAARGSRNEPLECQEALTCQK